MAFMELLKSSHSDTHAEKNNSAICCTAVAKCSPSPSHGEEDADERGPSPCLLSGIPMAFALYAFNPPHSPLKHLKVINWGQNLLYCLFIRFLWQDSIWQHGTEGGRWLEADDRSKELTSDWKNLREGPSNSLRDYIHLALVDLLQAFVRHPPMSLHLISNSTQIYIYIYIYEF